MHAELVCSLQISKSISTQRQEWLQFDATHSSKRYCGLDVYTVSFAWCVYEGWNNSDAWVSNVQEIGSSSFFGLLTFFLSFAVLHPNRELRFLVMGGSTSYSPLSRVHWLPRARRHLHPQAGVVRGTGFPKSIV
jgi:hypothetical protein